MRRAVGLAEKNSQSKDVNDSLVHCSSGVVLVPEPRASSRDSGLSLVVLRRRHCVMREVIMLMTNHRYLRKDMKGIHRIQFLGSRLTRY